MPRPASSCSRRDPGAQNVATARSGDGRQDAAPGTGPPDGVTRCPGNIGARNFPAGSYSPVDEPVLPLDQRHLHGERGRHAGPLPGVGPVRRWSSRGIISSGSCSRPPRSRPRAACCSRRRRIAISARSMTATGRCCGRARVCNDIPNAFPITYMVDGKQYIAMPVGNPGFRAMAPRETSPEYQRPEATSSCCGCGSCRSGGRVDATAGAWCSASMQIAHALRTIASTPQRRRAGSPASMHSYSR